MRPLPRSYGKRFWKARVALIALLTAGAWMLGCGAGGSVVPTPQPPPCITGTVNPSSGSIVLGKQMTFTATVTNTTETRVSWKGNGIAGRNAAAGPTTA